MEGSTEPTQALASVNQPNESAAVMEIIAKAAAEGRDVATLEKLMDLQERILRRNAKTAFAADFVRMKPHLKRVENTHVNSQTKSKYAKLEDINKEIDPILEQFGFSTSTKIVSQSEVSVTVRAELWHREGHIEGTDITMPLDRTGIAGTVNKTGPHALASSIKYARRVAICALLNISTGDGEDRDGNAEQSGTITIEQAAEIDLKLREASKTYAKPEQYIKNFCVHMGIEGDVRQIRAKDLQKAFNAIKPKAKEQSP